MIFLHRGLCKHIFGSLHLPHLIFRYKVTQPLILIINILSYISPKFSMVPSLIKVGFNTIIWIRFIKGTTINNLFSFFLLSRLTLSFKWTLKLKETWLRNLWYIFCMAVVTTKKDNLKISLLASAYKSILLKWRKKNVVHSNMIKYASSNEKVRWNMTWS